MGQRITAAIGMANPGRTVKVETEDGRMYPATLIGGDEKMATVKSQGMGQHFVAWDRVRDWTSRNTNALTKPLANGVASKKPTPAPTVVKVEPTQTDQFKVYQTLGPRLEKALSEVSAAEDLLDQALEQVQACKMAHDEAVAALADIRKEASEALSKIDGVLVGTRHAPAGATA